VAGSIAVTGSLAVVVADDQPGVDEACFDFADAPGAETTDLAQPVLLVELDYVADRARGSNGAS
jgi:hypothetical protein